MPMYKIHCITTILKSKPVFVNIKFIVDNDNRQKFQFLTKKFNLPNKLEEDI